MKTIEWWLETGKQGGDESGEIEVEDNTTEEEIDLLVREEVFNIVSWGWGVKDAPVSQTDKVEPERAADGNTYRYHATGLPPGGDAK